MGNRLGLWTGPLAAVWMRDCDGKKSGGQEGNRGLAQDRGFSMDSSNTFLNVCVLLGLRSDTIFSSGQNTK